jgi:hypothetical protein
MSLETVRIIPALKLATGIIIYAWWGGGGRGCAKCLCANHYADFCHARCQA